MSHVDSGEHAKRWTEKTDYGRVCPICASQIIGTNTYGIKEHMIDKHSLKEILNELVRLWGVVNR